MTETTDSEIVGETVQRLADMHQSLAKQTTPIQRVANRVTQTLGRPTFVSVVLLSVIAWVIANRFAAELGIRRIEEFPFPALELTATVAAFLLALVILTTQRHEEDLATKRAQLTLQIAVLSEKKIAKIIGLLEEQRRDNPLLESRADGEAEDMAKASDPQVSLEQMKASKLVE